MIDLFISILSWTWYYTKEAALWLFLGFLFAGILKAFVPSEFLIKYIGGNKLRSILTATLIGIPLPLCSCGVVPTGLGLYDQGASRASTLAFLISTPATTVTAILLTFGMLGSRFTIAEVLLCICVAVITGSLAGIILKEERETRSTFCLSKSTSKESIKKIKTIFQYGFIEMVDDTGLYIFLGLLGAGIITALLPSDLVAGYLGGSSSLIILVLVATPMYICSTASVPFVASLIETGMNPAAGLVILIVGPATNLSTIFAIGKTMGWKTAILYISSIIVFSVLIAYCFDLVGWI